MYANAAARVPRMRFIVRSSMDMGFPNHYELVHARLRGAELHAGGVNIQDALAAGNSMAPFGRRMRKGGGDFLRGTLELCQHVQNNILHYPTT